MIALVDGDLISYRCAASAENDEEDIAILRADKLFRDIIEAVQADTYRVFLTGSDNFRKKLDPEYKANRKDKPLPKHLDKCREFLVTEWKAEVQDGIEADDALGITQSEDMYAKECPVSGTGIPNTIICSLDKDLLQIPGKHYRWEIGTLKWTKPAEMLNIEYFDGLRHFYASSLIGDRSDNIRGVDGIGPVKANKLLSLCETEQEMFDICREMYNNDNRFFLNLKLLWIMREQNDVFDPIKRELINE